jgi:hypothetical protein
MKYIVCVRATLKSTDEQAMQGAHDEIVRTVSPLAKSMGDIAHQSYLNPQNRREFMAIDTWDNLEGIQKLYADPRVGESFANLFEGQPQVTIWAESGWFAY